MKLLVTGYGGQLGYDVVEEGRRRGLWVVGTTSNDLNITDENSISDYIYKMKPEAIIHCAAYTAVDKAEDDKKNCFDVNVNGTRYLATIAKEIGAKFVYISTDYVFDGKGEVPFNESSPPSPIGYYGETKYQGEQIVQSLLDKWFIVRISWVFGVNGKNFVKTMLRLAETRSELTVVGDQYGSPTYTVDIARLLIDLVQSDKYGIYHASNEGVCSWAEFASEIFKQANKDTQVISITSEQFPTRAIRPKNSRMSKQKLLDEGFNSLPPWQDAVRRFLNELDRRGELN